MNEIKKMQELSMVVCDHYNIMKCHLLANKYSSMPARKMFIYVAHKKLEIDLYKVCRFVNCAPTSAQRYIEVFQQILMGSKNYLFNDYLNVMEKYLSLSCVHNGA